MRCLMALVIAMLSLPATSMSLQDTVKQAIDFNPAVDIVEANVDIRLARLKQARAALHPLITLTAQDGVIRKTDSGGWHNGRDITAKLSQLLWDFGKTSENIRKENSTVKQTYIRQEEGKQEVALLATNAFLEVLRFKGGLAETQENINFYREFLQLIKKRHEAGASPLSEIERIRSLLQDAKTEQVNIQTELNTAKEIFRLIVGKPPQGLQPPQLNKIAFNIEIEPLINNAFRHNLALQDRQANVEQQMHNLNSLSGALYPNLKLEMEHKREHTLDTSDRWENSTEAKFVLRYDIWDGHKARSRVGEAKALLVRSENELMAEKLDLERRLRESFNALIESEDQRKINSEALITNKKLVDLYYKEFRIGERGILDITTAQSDFHRIRLEQIDIRFNYFQSLFEILADAGRLLPIITELDGEQPTINVEEFLNAPIKPSVPEENDDVCVMDVLCL